MTEGSRNLPITPLLNQLPSDALENASVIKASETVKRVLRRKDGSHELHAQSSVKESQVVQPSSYKRENVLGMNLTILVGKVEACKDEKASSTRTL